MDSIEEFMVRFGLTPEKFIDIFLDLAKRVAQIKSFPIVRERLEELERAGADPKFILIHIVLMCPRGGNWTSQHLSKLEKRFSSLARRLESLYKEIDATISDPMAQTLFWKIMLVDEGSDFAAAEKRYAGVKHNSNWLKVFVNYFKAEAKAAQRIRRDCGKPKENARLGPILRHVKETTGEFHDECIADLLQGAYDALGVPGKFSAEKLRKLRQRKLPAIVRKRRAPSGFDQLYGKLIN